MKKKFETQIKELTAQSQGSLAQVTQVKGEGSHTIQSLT